MNEGSAADRRREERVAVEGNLYVVVDTQPQMMGQMVEISSTGLAFTFVDLESVSRRLEDRSALSLDLFAGGQGYFLRDLRCRLVSRTEKAIHDTMSSYLIKRIGVEFEYLTLPQQVAINALVKRQNQRCNGHLPC